ncbi:MAG: hypothetical protein ACM3ZB_14835 [bacterium]
MRFARARSVSANPQADASEYHDWRPPSAPVSVRLSYGVIDRLRADVMNDFWAVPKRGAEVGGILLGRVTAGPDSDTLTQVVVEDYECVPCEHRRGPSYVLSEPDRKRLARALRRSGGLSVVGYFRSHTRPGLYLDENDMAIVSSQFSAPSDVVLLIRPHATAPGVAGFFIWENDDMRRHSPYLTFPFDTAALRATDGAQAPVETGTAAGAAPVEIDEKARLIEEPEASEAETLAADARTSTAEESLPPSGSDELRPARKPAPGPIPRRPAEPERTHAPVLFAPESPRRVRIGAPRMKTVAWVMAVLAGMAALEYQILAGRPQPAEPPAHAASLRVERSGDYLRLHWDAGAPAVRNADRAVLVISEGELQKEYPLDRGQLSIGSVTYVPSGNDVTFRLELHQADRKVSEAVRVITGEAQQTPAREAQAAKPVVRRPDDTEARLKARTEAAGVAAKPRSRPRRAFFDDGL